MAVIDHGQKGSFPCKTSRNGPVERQALASPDHYNRYGSLPRRPEMSATRPPLGGRTTYLPGGPTPLPALYPLPTATTHYPVPPTTTTCTHHHPLPRTTTHHHSAVPATKKVHCPRCRNARACAPGPCHSIVERPFRHLRRQPPTRHGRQSRPYKGQGPKNDRYSSQHGRVAAGRECPWRDHLRPPGPKKSATLRSATRAALAAVVGRACPWRD